MHRGHAVPVILFAMIFAACGGRIIQGENFQANANPQGSGSPTPAPTTTPTGSYTSTPTPTTPIPNSGPPTPFAPCGSGTCGANEECCVGGSPDGNEDNETAPLESCVPNGTCNTGLQLDCWPTEPQCGVGAVCCITINPTTEYATAGCAATCGGNGVPAVQICASDADCPPGDSCFVAAIGPNGEGETTQVCGGVR
ncbi:MAG: hypothetical protein ABI183_21535 [Polyangiaceae bacterium]